MTKLVVVFRRFADPLKNSYLTRKTALKATLLISYRTYNAAFLLTYRQFNIQQFYVLPTQCIYVFCVDLRTNSHYFPIQH